MYPYCDDFTIIRIYHWNPLDHDLFELFDLFIDTRESILSQFGTHHHPNAKIQKYQIKHNKVAIDIVISIPSLIDHEQNVNCIDNPFLKTKTSKRDEDILYYIFGFSLRFCVFHR